jgi:hypothetical protein
MFKKQNLPLSLNAALQWSTALIIFFNRACYDQWGLGRGRKIDCTYVMTMILEIHWSSLSNRKY